MNAGHKTFCMVGVFLLLVLFLDGHAFSSSFDENRILPVSGNVSVSDSCAEIELKSSGMRSGAKCVYVTQAQNGQFIQNVKLFPGQNLVTTKTSSGAAEMFVPLKVERPTLRFELSYPGPTEKDSYWLEFSYNGEKYGVPPNTDIWGWGWGSADQGIVFQNAAAGRYGVSVFHSVEQTIPSPVTTTVRVYVNDERVYTASNGNGIDSWSVGTFILHSGESVGGYTVADNNRLDITGQGERAGCDRNVFSDLSVTQLSGPNGSAPVLLKIGESAQFAAEGVLQGLVCGGEQYTQIIEGFSSSDTSVGDIDALGVFVAKATGHTQVSCQGYGGDPIDVYVVQMGIEADCDLDGDVDAKDITLRSTLSPVNGWCVPMATNVYRKVCLVGGDDEFATYTLSLSGDMGVFRVWTTDTPSLSATPLLVCGQSVTHGEGVSFLTGAHTELYVEAVGNGTAKLTYEFTGTGEAEGLRCAAELGLTGILIESVDLVAAPFNGLVVKNGEPVAMMANILPDSYVPREGEPKWYYQQLNDDGSWGNWTSFGGSATGTLYQHATTASGIFRVKAVLSEQGFTLEKQLLRTDDDSFSNLKMGDPDAFGVVDTETQRTLRSTASAEIGSTYYAENGGLPAWRDPRGLFLTWPKCNVFVADMCDAAGANVDPPVGGIYLAGPPSANRWAGMPDVNDAGAPYPIPDWTLLPLNTKPQPGYVVASGYESNSSGHCGIVDYDGRWISAGHDTVNRNAEFSDTSYWRHYESGLTTPPGVRVYAP